MKPNILPKKFNQKISIITVIMNLAWQH